MIFSFFFFFFSKGTVIKIRCCYNLRVSVILILLLNPFPAVYLHFVIVPVKQDIDLF